MRFDPRRILEALAKHGVEYIIVGGLGGTLYGSPMSTDDVDIVPELTQTNLKSLTDALEDLGAKIASEGEPEGVKLDFTCKILQEWIFEFRFLNFVTDYGRLDLIYRPSGTGGFKDLASGSELLDIGDLHVRVAALEDIIRSKEAAGRNRDRAHLPTLRMLLEKLAEGELLT